MRLGVERFKSGRARPGEGQRGATQHCPTLGVGGVGVGNTKWQGPASRGVGWGTGGAEPVRERGAAARPGAGRHVVAGPGPAERQCTARPVLCPPGDASSPATALPALPAQSRRDTRPPNRRTWKCHSQNTFYDAFAGK